MENRKICFNDVGNKNFYSDNAENKKRPKRKLNRLKGYDYSQNGFYFITICTKNRNKFFGEITGAKMELSEIGKIAQKCWEEIPLHFPDAESDEFIVMPNHIHGIIIIKNSSTVGNKNFCSIPDNAESNNYCSAQWQTKWARSLSSIMRGLKIGVTKWCRNNYFSQFAWQKSYYDHIIRDEESLQKIREYIINNPSQWEQDRNNPENLWM